MRNRLLSAAAALAVVATLVACQDTGTAPAAEKNQPKPSFSTSSPVPGDTLPDPQTTSCGPVAGSGNKADTTSVPACET